MCAGKGDERKPGGKGPNVYMNTLPGQIDVFAFSLPATKINSIGPNEPCSADVDHHRHHRSGLCSHSSLSVERHLFVVVIVIDVLLSLEV